MVSFESPLPASTRATSGYVERTRANASRRRSKPFLRSKRDRNSRIVWALQLRMPFTKPARRGRQRRERQRVRNYHRPHVDTEFHRFGALLFTREVDERSVAQDAGFNEPEGEPLETRPAIGHSPTIEDSQRSHDVRYATTSGPIRQQGLKHRKTMRGCGPCRNG